MINVFNMWYRLHEIMKKLKCIQEEFKILNHL